MTTRNDFELLDAYARQQSEEAFHELVARHIDFVYSAAMRQLQNPHLAQEATQAAFIALADKANQLPRQTIIAGWLHHAARFAALNLRRTEARQKHWEQKAVSLSPALEGEEMLPEEALSHVDAALGDLDERDRNAVILRFFRQMSLRDVGGAIGVSEEAAKKRVSRALDRMRDLLVRRGVTVSATALAVGLSQLPVSAAPPLLPSMIATLAVQAPPVLGGGTAALVASAKWKLAIAAGGALLCGLVILFWPWPSARQAATNGGVNSTTNAAQPFAMRVQLTSVMVDDQEKALRFYTNVLGFAKKADFPIGPKRWLTVASPDEPAGAELVLEPMGFAPARVYQAALFRSGIPLTAFVTDDLQREYERMVRLGTKFKSRPKKMGPTLVAMFEDTCGNNIQLLQLPDAPTNRPAGIRLKFTSVTVDDQDKAERFYTGVLGFRIKEDVAVDGGRWLTVVSPDEPEGMELALEPMGFASSRVYQKALFDAGIPLASLQVVDVERQYERLAKLGVEFRTKPVQAGPVKIAMFDDTCGNLIQMFQPSR